jgi:hypothetical protein
MVVQEITLGTLGSDEAGQRVSVCLVRSEAGGCSRLCLREESYSPDVGWFIQSEVELCPTQVAQLRGLLGTIPAAARKPAVACEESGCEEPCVLKFSAVRAG